MWKEWGPSVDQIAEYGAEVETWVLPSWCSDTTGQETFQSWVPTQVSQGHEGGSHGAAASRVLEEKCV